MDATTEKLVDYTLEAQYEGLSPETVTACTNRILDTLGCAAGAYDHPVSVAARRLAARYAMDTPATILGSGNRCAPEMAAFANGVMLRVLDMSDTYRVKCGGHPSDIMSAAFAAAEIAGSDGKELIAAIATGYEIYCGCCEAIDLNSMGWDQPVYGVIASAMAAGKLLRLTREALAETLALAVVPNMPLYQTRQGELSAWKGCAGANAARNGLFAALLAQSGISGPEMPFEGKFGLYDIVGAFDWPLTPGEPPFRIAQTHIKCFPICYHGQSAVWTALGLRNDIAVDAIETVEVATYATAFKMMANDRTRWAPQTRETADHSLPYVVGTALLQGTVDESSFSDRALQDPAIGKLMSRISVVEDPSLTAQFPGKSPSRITVHLANGENWQNELDFPKGHAKSPMAGGEIRDKFKGLFSTFGTDRQADAVIDAVDGLKTAPTLDALIEAFAKA